MNKLVSLSAALLALPLAATAGTAYQDRAGNLYFGAGIGNATVDSDSVIIDGDVGSLNDNDMSFNVNVGYNLTEHLSIDVGYQDWGKLSDNIAGQRTKAEIDMIALSLVGRLPIAESFDLFGRVGVGFVNSDLSVDFVDSETDEVIQGPSDSVDSEDLLYGVGADWNISKQFLVRLEMDFLELSGASTARNLSLSAIYEFDLDDTL